MQVFIMPCLMNFSAIYTPVSIPAHAFEISNDIALVAPIFFPIKAEEEGS